MEHQTGQSFAISSCLKWSRYWPLRSCFALWTALILPILSDGGKPRKFHHALSIDLVKIALGQFDLTMAIEVINLFCYHAPCLLAVLHLDDAGKFKGGDKDAQTVFELESSIFCFYCSQFIARNMSFKLICKHACCFHKPGRLKTTASLQTQLGTGVI